jgi:hypothetical protein
VRRKKMAYDITVILENRPGTLAQMGEVLGQAGINIDGMCGFLVEGKGEIHILVRNGSAARKVLEKAGIDARNVRPVLVRDLEDKPGTLGEAARRLADAGINLDLLYLASDNRLVMGVDPGSDDWDKARSII